MDWYLSHLIWGANSELAYFGHSGRAEEVREQKAGLACSISTKELATLQTDPRGNKRLGPPDKETSKPL